jgi:hypothetical protein
MPKNHYLKFTENAIQNHLIFNQIISLFVGWCIGYFKHAIMLCYVCIHPVVGSRRWCLLARVTCLHSLYKFKLLSSIEIWPSFCSRISTLPSIKSKGLSKWTPLGWNCNPCPFPTYPFLTRIHPPKSINLHAILYLKHPPLSCLKLTFILKCLNSTYEHCNFLK